MIYVQLAAFTEDSPPNAVLVSAGYAVDKRAVMNRAYYASYSMLSAEEWPEMSLFLRHKIIDGIWIATTDVCSVNISRVCQESGDATLLYGR